MARIFELIPFAEAGRSVSRHDVVVGVCVMPSCRHGSSVEPSQPGEVVGEIGQADFGSGANHADGPHDQVQAAFLGGEDVLDAGADASSGGIAAGNVRRPLGFLRWNCGLRPRRSSRARFAAER